jgi:hypothetical protein
VCLMPSSPRLSPAMRRAAAASQGFCPGAGGHSRAMSRPRKLPEELLDRGAWMGFESRRLIAMCLARRWSRDPLGAHGGPGSWLVQEVGTPKALAVRVPQASRLPL